MNLATRYLGLDLKNPIAASPGPMTRSLDGMKALEDAGAAAVVMPSLFEEQIKLESEALHHYLMEGAESFPEALSYLPDLQGYNAGPEEYLETIRKAKSALEIPVFGSLNGHTTGGWTSHARRIEEAGADGLELNIYFLATDPNVPGSEIERQYCEIVSEVRRTVSIPLAVKLAPFFSSTANMARRIAEAGADGLVLFNRFYQPDIDLDTLEVEPSLKLSDSYAARLPLHWIAILYGRVHASLAASSGAHSAADVLKLLMSGADVVMMCSALLKHGAGHVSRVLADLREWMEEREYESVEQMKGSLSMRGVGDAAAYERVNYIRTLEAYKVTPGANP